MLRRVLIIATLLIHSATGCSWTRSTSGPDSSPAVYDAPVILFVSPDEAALERLRAELGEDFYTVADDAMWYRAEAYECAERAGIAHEATGRGAATFLFDGKPHLFTWAEEDRLWFNVYYDGSHEPRILYDIELPGEVETLLKEN